MYCLFPTLADCTHFIRLVDHIPDVDDGTGTGERFESLILEAGVRHPSRIVLHPQIAKNVASILLAT